MTAKPSTDYAARQTALRAKREAEGYYTPEETARRQGRLEGGRDYNARISGKVEVSTTEYEFAHGRKPRGYGSWAFVAASGETTWVTDNYGAAKRQLKPGAYRVGS